MQSNGSEFLHKVKLMRYLLEQHHADGLLLRRVSSFAWATCGAALYINMAVTQGAASLLVTHDECFLITNNIEAPRMEEEEHLAEQGWTLSIAHWTNPMKELNRLTAGLRLISDVPFGDAMLIEDEMARLRAHLTEEEENRFRKVGKLCAKAMNEAAHSETRYDGNGDCGALGC
jgi:Xaa-Pro aminopeptidase